MYLPTIIHIISELVSIDWLSPLLVYVIHSLLRVPGNFELDVCFLGYWIFLYPYKYSWVFFCGELLLGNSLILLVIALLGRTTAVFSLETISPPTEAKLSWVLCPMGTGDVWPHVNWVFFTLVFLGGSFFSLKSFLDVCPDQNLAEDLTGTLQMFRSPYLCRILISAALLCNLGTLAFLNFQFNQ